MEKGKTLVIWMVNGNTLFFENVDELKNGDSELTFNYFGVSTKTKRSAVFNQINIAGFALQD